MTNLSPDEIVDSLSFCVLDLETTGGNHKKDKIIEIGMVKVVGRKVVGEKSFLINPEVQIPDFIQKLTKISQNAVKDAPKIEQVIDEIIDFIGDDIIVAHNTSFDVPFLNGTISNLGKDELQNKVICTNVMTKHLIPEILSSNLNYMSRLFNINHSKAHRAHDDAMATARLLIIYLNIFSEKGIKKVNQLYYPRNKFELDRVHLDNASYSNENVISYLGDKESSILLTVKGDRGLILAVIPLKSPKDETEIVASVLKDLDWKMITIKLLRPFLEGIFQFNNHFFKYPEGTRDKILNYLTEKYHTDKEVKPLEKYDFIIGHHLVSDQVLVYSFLHLNTNTKFLFKIPAQKKKLYQHLNTQINRFENHQKGRRKHLIHKELVPLVEKFLGESLQNEQYLSLDRKNIRQDKDATIEIVESFAKNDNNQFNFPTTHL